MRLEGRIALVTGAGRGIGHEIATLFASQGAAVVGADVSHSVPASTGVQAVDLDVTAEDQWRDVVSRIVAGFGRIDILVNNAGGSLGSQAGVTELALDEWNRVIALNQTSVFLGMREVVPPMIGSGGGAIVNVSSVYGIAAVGRMAAYQTVKAAVRHLTKVAAVAYAADGVRVNSVHPGLIKTPATDKLPAAGNSTVLAATPLGRIGVPSDVAAGCLYLASDESSFVTGAELVIDGGYLAQGDASGAGRRMREEV